MLGNAHQLLRASQLHLTAEQWAKRYGPIMRVDVGRRRVVVLNDADEISVILRNRPEGFRRSREQQIIFDEIMPRGVFIAEGDGDAGLNINRTCAGFIEEAGEGRVGVEAFDDDVVVVAAEGEIEAEEDLQVLDFQRADAQVIGSKLKQELVQQQRIIQLRRIDEAAHQPLGFQADPTVAAVAAVFFQVEIAVVVVEPLDDSSICDARGDGGALELVRQAALLRQRRFQGSESVRED